MANTLTVLKTTEGRVTTKTPTRLPKGGWVKENFLAGTLLMCLEFPVDGIERFHVVIVVISRFQNCFVIRGSPRGHVDLTKPVYRRKDEKWDDTAHFVECPRMWLMIGIDKLILGDHLDLFGDPEAAVEEAIRKVLPEQYHDVSFVWQLSSSARTIDPPGSRIRWR